MRNGEISVANDDRRLLERTWARPPGFVGWLAQVNHKAVGLRYMVTGFVFFLLAGLDALRIRAQLAVPQNTLLGPDAYDAAFTMHGTTMMFLFAVPILEGLGIYLVPLMIGARDMALPRLNAFGYWIFLFAGVALWSSYLFGTPPTSGWFAYPPLTRKEFQPGPGMDFWATSVSLLELALIVAAIELIITIFKQRAPGMSLNRMPIFVWAMLVTAFMVLFAMPPILLATLMLELDRAFGMHFFNPLAGGDALLWQHLFWWFGHPDVYILQLPAFGIVTAVVIATARRPIFGYTAIVLATFAVGFLSFGLWVHHMFATGLPLLGMSFFGAASMMIAIPSGVQVFCWIVTIWNGRVQLTTSFLFVVGAIVTFVMGGVTGVMLGSVPFDLQVHDSFFVVAHFHYVLFGAVVFPVFAGLYHWFPKITGQRLSERLGKWAFALMFAGFHLTFFPQHQLGFMGMPRRVFTYLDELGWGELNLLSSVGSFLLAFGVLLFLLDVLWSYRFGRPAGENPWDADSLEWATSSPPAVYNFQHIPTVRSPYPLWQADEREERVRVELRSDRRETLTTRLHDAVPEGRMLLPGPTLLPLWAAMAVALMFSGLIIHPLLIPLGAVLAFTAIAVWNWPSHPPSASSSTEEDGGGTPAAANAARRTGEAAPGPTVPRTEKLPVHLHGPETPLWWATLFLVLVQAVGFVTLIASYLYLRSVNAEWPPQGTALPEPLLAGVAGGLLLASAVALGWGQRGMAAGSRWRLQTGLTLGVVLGVGFLVLMTLERSLVDYRWDTHAYGSVIWTTVLLHLLHVLVLVLAGILLLLLALRGHFTAERRQGIQVFTLVWQFVALIWIPLFVVLYLLPYAVPS